LNHPLKQPLALPLPPARSRRARVVARWFGLKPASDDAPTSHRSALPKNFIFPQPGQIILIGGPSGSGKSSILRAACAHLPAGHFVDLNQLNLPGVPVVDCFGASHIGRVLKLLSRVGLSEAWTYLRRPEELSEGQRWRLRVAIGIEHLRRNPEGILI